MKINFLIMFNILIKNIISEIVKYKWNTKEKNTHQKQVGIIHNIHFYHL